MRTARLVIAASTVAVLAWFALAYGTELLSSGLLWTAPWLTTFLFVVELLKTTIIFALKDLRGASPATVVDLYGADLLVIPALAVANLVHGGPAIPAILPQVFTGWMAGAALGGLIYTSYRIGRSMLRSGELKTIIPGSLLAAEIGLVFYGSALTADASGKGMAGFVQSVLGGGVNLSTYGVSVFAALGVLFASLAAYAANGASWNGPTETNLSLLLASLSVAAVLGCSILVSAFGLPVTLVFALLTVAAVSVSWWAGHEA